MFKFVATCFCFILCFGFSSGLVFAKSDTVLVDLFDIGSTTAGSNKLKRSNWSLNAKNSKNRKEFIDSVTSAVRYVNQKILWQRTILEKKKNKIPLNAKEQKIYDSICKFYRSKNLDELFLRVAPVPVSMAVAQASLESGFGSNRHISQINAYFGLVKDAKHLYKFDTLLESVIAYSKTLNANKVYRKFREKRAKIICDNHKIDGMQLSKFIGNYGINPRYVKLLCNLIRNYKLDILDSGIPPNLVQAANYRIVKKHAKFTHE